MTPCAAHILFHFVFSVCWQKLDDRKNWTTQHRPNLCIFSFACSISARKSGVLALYECTYNWQIHCSQFIVTARDLTTFFSSVNDTQVYLVSVRFILCIRALYIFYNCFFVVYYCCSHFTFTYFLSSRFLAFWESLFGFSRNTNTHIW